MRVENGGVSTQKIGVLPLGVGCLGSHFIPFVFFWSRFGTSCMLQKKLKTGVL